MESNRVKRKLYEDDSSDSDYENVEPLQIIRKTKPTIDKIFLGNIENITFDNESFYNNSVLITKNHSGKEIRAYQQSKSKLFYDIPFFYGNGSKNAMLSDADMKSDKFWVARDVLCKQYMDTKTGKVIKEHLVKRYASFANPMIFEKWFRKIPKRDHMFHELVRSDRPASIYLDIEVYSELKDKEIIENKAKDILESAKNAVDETLSKVLQIHDFKVPNDNWVVSDSSRLTSSQLWKHSFHLIAKEIYFENANIAMSQFMQLLVSSTKIKNAFFLHPIQKAKIPIFDIQVYSKDHLIRLPESYKHPSHDPSMTILKLCSNHSLSNATIMVTPGYDSKLITSDQVCQAAKRLGVTLSNIKKTKTSVSMNCRWIGCNYEITNALTQLLRNNNDQNTTITGEFLQGCYNCLNNGSRLCLISQREHDNENCYLTVDKEGTVWYHCYRGQQIDSCKGKKRMGNISHIIHKYRGQEFELQIDSKMIYSEIKQQYVESYNSCKTKVILVKSPMNTGKSYALKQLLDTTCINKEKKEFDLNTKKHLTEKYQSVLIICPRIQFAKTMCGLVKETKLPFVYYKDVSWEYDNLDFLIIEYESIHHLMKQDEQTYDVIILDECESILVSVTGEMNKDNMRKNSSIFEHLLKEAKFIVASDADLSQRTVNLFNQLIGPDQITLRINKYQSLEREINIYHNEQSWIEEIRSSLNENKKLVFISGNKEKLQIDIIQAIIEKEFPWLNGKIYTSDSSESDMNDFEDVNTSWAKYDYIGYTSRCTVGADFKIPDHFDILFIYGCPSTNTVREIIQMSGRCRYPTEKEMHIYIQGNNVELPETFTSIENDMIERKAYLEGIEADLFSSCWSVPRWFCDTYIFNLTERNLSQNNFSVELRRFARNNNWVVKEAESKNNNQNKEWKEIRKNFKTIRDQKQQSEFDIAPILQDYVIDEYLTKIRRGKATQQDKIAVIKYFWQTNFQESIDWKHYNTLFRYKEQLFQIYISKNAIQSEILQNDVKQCENIFYETKNLYFPRISLINQVTNLLGLENCHDYQTQIKKEKIEDVSKNIWKIRNEIRREFRLTRLKSLNNDKPNFRNLLDLVNAMLREWNCVKLKNDKDNHTYQLTQKIIYEEKTLDQIAQTMTTSNVKENIKEVNNCLFVDI